MTLEFEDQTYLTDNDLQVRINGSLPKMEISHPELRSYFEKEFGRTFLGPDEIIAFSQNLVSRGIDFAGIEETIAGELAKGANLKEVIFNKMASGIGRGHSLGGLADLGFVVNGTKMIDAGLTGFCMSRSLVTSGRRREAKEEEIVVPECFRERDNMLREYLEISKRVFADIGKFKSSMGKTEGIETFNKAMAYNGPADLEWVVPLDTLVNLAMEVRRDQRNSNGQFLPRELHSLANMFEGLTEKAGMGVMYKQRLRVPRDTYLHYNVFTDPSMPTFATEMVKGLEPKVINVTKSFTQGFFIGLERLKQFRNVAMQETNPGMLVQKAKDYVSAMNEFVNGYNDVLKVQVLDSVSWRVWSEQKRHATLRQGVESIYSAADRAHETIKDLWSRIEMAYQGRAALTNEELEKLENVIVIDDRLKRNKELLDAYVYHSARQLMFYGEMIKEGFERRDALFMVPRNVRVKVTETYDLINLIDLEFPLRLCKTCEPERYMTSWKKRGIIKRAVPELEDFLRPKCSVGYCTEEKSCGYIRSLRAYDDDFHKNVKRIMLALARR